MSTGSIRFSFASSSRSTARMQGDLEDVMNLKRDQVLIIDLGENQDTARAATTVLGQALGGMDIWTWG